MNGHTVDVDVNLFRKKESGIVFSGQPKHGSVAWRRSGNDWEELIYWQSLPDESGWVTAEEFRHRKKNKKEKKTRFYLANPHLLQEKINAKRRETRKLCEQAQLTREQAQCQCPGEEHLASCITGYLYSGECSGTHFNGASD